MQIQLSVKKTKRPMRSLIVDNLRRTWRNKLFALGFFVFGVLAMYATHDATLSVFTTLVSASIFFSKKDIWKNN